MNWGWKVALGYSAFVIGMLVLVFKSVQQRHDLVIDNYYAREGEYSKNLVLAAKTAHLGSLKVNMGAQGLSIGFPEALRPQAAGEIHLYRPSDERLDQRYSFELSPEDSGWVAPRAHLASGKWLVKVAWQAAGEPFYFEESFIAP